MRADRRNPSDDELRKLLNLGDPAGDGHPPDAQEIAAMRRTVLNAVDTGAATRPWLSSSFVTAAATVAVAHIALAILLRAGPWGTVLQPETGPATPAETAPAAPIDPAAAESPSAVAAEPSLEPSPEEVPQGMEPQAASEAAVAELPEAAANQRPEVAAGELTLAAVEESLDIAAPVAARERRTVQFTAPGGTRIIWTLDPDFQLPVSEPDDRARGEL